MTNTRVEIHKDIETANEAPLKPRAVL
jgi:hypothetical protein